MIQERVTFQVQGSAPVPYDVTFEFTNGQLSASCNCPAGEHGQYCKHRFRILSGSIDGIVSDNTADVAAVQSWFKGTELHRAIESLLTLEREAEELKKRISKEKKIVARVMQLH